MTSFRALVRDSWSRTESARWLVVVPFVWSFAQFHAVASVLGLQGFSVGVRFPTPAALPTMWTFARAPQPGVVVGTPPSMDAPSLVVANLLFSTLVGGLLTAGFLGALHASTTGRKEGFGESVTRYGLRQTLFAGCVALAGTAVFAVTALVPPLFLLAFPGSIVAGYLFYATPFLVVTDDLTLGDAFGRSYHLALRGGGYFSFFLGYLGVGALCSIPITLVSVNLGVLGLLAGATLTAPLCLAFAAATLTALDEIDGPNGSGDPSVTGSGVNTSTRP
ncbi:hypothetical protein [Halomarina rubra]|uniref:Uncharacterized protein n=1 Tax=Halomarina rubra TaxID=2071873 RepID=A0ABD6AVH4_9EURY|nr:hypothetical protein [Halomarina rubra]